MLNTLIQLVIVDCFMSCYAKIITLSFLFISVLSILHSLATTQTIYSPSLMDRPIQDDFMLGLKINTLMDVEMFDLKNGGINEDKCNS